MQESDSRKRSPSGARPLTERQTDVLDRLAQGQRTAEIAHGMKLKPETVNAHILRIRKKLKAKTNAQAIANWLGYSREKEHSEL